MKPVLICTASRRPARMDGLSSAILKRHKAGGAIKAARRHHRQGMARCGGHYAGFADARAYYRPDQYDELPLDMMRGAIATRLTQSMRVPHFYLTVRFPLTR